MSKYVHLDQKFQETLYISFILKHISLHFTNFITYLGAFKSKSVKSLSKEVLSGF